MLGTNNILELKCAKKGQDGSWAPPKPALHTHPCKGLFDQNISGSDFFTVRPGKALLNNLFTPVLNSFIKTSRILTTQVVFNRGWSHIYSPTVSIGTNQTRAKLTLIKQWQEFTGGWMSVLTTPRIPDTFPNAKSVAISHHFPFIINFINSSCSSLRITWRQATLPWFMRLQWEKKKITPIVTSTMDHFLLYNLWTNKRLLGCCSEGAEVESPSLGQTDRTEEHQGDRETSLLCSELGWHWEDSGSNSGFPWNWEDSSWRLETALDTSFLTLHLKLPV